MSKILYPRSDSISAKVIEPSDFETMFGFIGDYIVNGFTVTAGSGLAVNVASGKIRLKGLVCDNTATESVGSLTDTTTNYIYVQLTRDGNSEAESWNFTTNTTGTTPTDALKIASVVTSGGSVSSVSQVNLTDTLKYAILPTGTIQMFAGQYNNIPNNWLLCDGTAISRTTYKDLFDIVGTQFGTGDGSTTFNIPDLQAKFPRGAPTSTNAGATGGEDSHILSISELPAHSHGVTDSGHSHSGGAAAPSSSGYFGINEDVRSQASTGSSTTGISIQNTGSGAAHENRPAYLEILYMIRV